MSSCILWIYEVDEDNYVMFRLHFSLTLKGSLPKFIFLQKLIITIFHHNIILFGNVSWIIYTGKLRNNFMLRKF